jgi:hypothetical protein
LGLKSGAGSGRFVGATGFERDATGARALIFLVSTNFVDMISGDDYRESRIQF